MCKRKILTIVVVLGVLVTFCSTAMAISIDVPNGTFHMYKPGTNYTVIATFPGAGYCNGGFGENIPWLNATITYGDGTSGTTVDIPGWITPVESQGSPTATAQLFSSGYDETDGSSCLNCFGAWSGGNGNLAESAESLGDIAAGSTYTLSAMLTGDPAPVTFELRAGGVVLTPSSSVTPEAPAGWEVISRTYKAGDLVAYIGEPMTILIGTSRPGDGEPELTGSRARFDNVSFSYEAPNRADIPIPADEATDVSRDVVLGWKPGVAAATRDVYFGETFEEVDNATVPTGLALDTNSFDPGRMEFSKTYYWRVDEVNGTPDKTVFKGSVWSFEVEPYSIPIAGSEIIVTASSSSNDFTLPQKTLDGSGLGEDNTHDIKTETMWFSAMGDMEPWIQYEFDGVEKLDIMTVWNSNSAAEGFIGYGVMGVEIAYSVDGETWSVFEDVNEFSRAPGSPSYNQYDEINLGGLAAKMIRLNVQSNFGGFMQSYSLSDVQFSMIPAAARMPVPESGSAGISPDALLSWRAGREAAQSTIYLGTDPNEVADGLTASVTSNTNRTNLSAFDIEMGQTYYWRVDEVNQAEATSVWAGPVWSFSTVTSLVVDDFESYHNDSPDRPFQTWLDGIGYSADEFFPAAYGGNGTGAGIGHDIWSVASEHYNGSIMETVNALPGSGQSMPFYYTNSGGVASKTERTFAQPQDWTAGGAKTLSIAFNGQAGNTGTMFIMINNVKITYDRDNGNISRGSWQAWNIDLATVDTTPSNITKLTLGVEGAGASGMILFDDIRLFPGAGEILTPEDPGTNGLVGAWSFDAGSGTVAGDSSGQGLNGTIIDGTWEDGIQGKALNFNGVSSYVNIDGFKGITAVDGVQPAFTISNWIKTVSDGEMVTWGLQGAATRLTWRVESGILRTEHAAGNLRGDTLVNDDEWHHVALVVTEGANLQVPATQFYLDGLPDTTNSGSDTPYNLTPDSDVRIGMSGPQGGRFFTGLIDEVQLYDRALTGTELLWLAGWTEVIDKPF